MGSTKNKPSEMELFIKNHLNRDYLRKIIFDPNYITLTCWCLLLVDFLLNIFVIERIKYTEIDWIAYMQEVEGFLNGTFDYKLLKGNTGPLVYPAGFVYFYSILYYVTSQGRNVYLAQYIFLGIYMVQMYLVYEIFKKTCKIPPYALVLSTLTSYRIHSIYVLRLFNDPVAVLFFYISLHLFLKNKWLLGSLFYSLAVSVKMNILLYAPCLLVAYLTNLSYKEAALNLFVCGCVQLVLGAPFLYANFWSYIKGSFDLGRVFEHKWTVNYRFLDESFFADRSFHLGLLALHVLLLLVFLPHVSKYLSSYAKLNVVIRDFKLQSNKASNKKPKRDDEALTEGQETFLRSYENQLNSSGGRQRTKQKTVCDEANKKETFEINFSKITQLFVLPFFVTNLIGIACARSLHYQFYCWYFNSLIYLVHCTPFRKPIIYLILGVIEFCWNTYPSTNASSVMLHLSHITLLYGIYKNIRRQQ